MSIRRTLAVARKEFRHILRDLRTFFLVTISPTFLLLTLSYIFAFEVQQVNLAVWDADDSRLSRQYVEALTADGDLQVRARVASYEEMDRLLTAGRVEGGLVISPGFEDELRAGRQVRVQAVVDGEYPISGQQAELELDRRTAAFAYRFLQPPSEIVVEGLDVRSEAWYNEALDSLVSMVPGLIPIVLCMPTLALALALAREKETGSLESLIVTPIRGTEYLLGKLTAYLASGLVSLVLVWLMAVAYFRVPFRGSLFLYLLLAADYLLASMGFSMLIANFVDSQQTAMFLTLMVFFVPSFFVAGLVTPVDAGNLGSQLVGYVLPATHFITVSRGVFLKGLSLEPLALQALILAGMGAGGLLASLLLFEKRLD
jgi:ABC-2 type transport system permease protein